MAPALLDRYLARTGFDSQQTDQHPPSGESNLFEPVDRRPDGTDHGAHGVFDTTAHSHSLEAALSRHPTAAAAAVVLGGAAVKALLARRRRTG